MRQPDNKGPGSLLIRLVRLTLRAIFRLLGIRSKRSQLQEKLSTAPSVRPSGKISQEILYERMIVAAGCFVITEAEASEFGVNMIEFPCDERSLGYITLGTVNRILVARNPRAKREDTHSLHDLIHLVGGFDNGADDEVSVSRCEDLFYSLIYEPSRVFSPTRALDTARRIFYGISRANPHHADAARLFADNLSRFGKGVSLKDVNKEALLLRYPVRVSSGLPPE